MPASITPLDILILLAIVCCLVYIFAHFARR